MTITGTCYFVSRTAAIRYYRYYAGEGEDAPHVVERKIAAGEIHIGMPPLKENEGVRIIDNGTRYAVVPL
jgi:hypothetical protein